MLSALVSWRVEPEVNRAYVWLTDGTVIGHRDLDSGLDHPSAPEHAALLAAIASERDRAGEPRAAPVCIMGMIPT